MLHTKLLCCCGAAWWVRVTQGCWAWSCIYSNPVLVWCFNKMLGLCVTARIVLAKHSSSVIISNVNHESLNCLLLHYLWLVNKNRLLKILWVSPVILTNCIQLQHPFLGSKKPRAKQSANHSRLLLCFESTAIIERLSDKLFNSSQCSMAAVRSHTLLVS